MAYNSFFSNILARIALLLLTIFGLAWLFINQERFFTLIFLGLLVILQIFLLFSYLNRTNQNLARFLLLLTQEDTSVVLWKDKVERTFQGLHHSFEKVNQEISRIRMEKEKGNILLQRTMDHMSTGILAADVDGRIEIVNSEALKIFRIPRLNQLTELDQVDPAFTQALVGLKYDSGNIIHLKNEDGGKLPLLVRVSLLKLEEKTLRIYSIQNIKTELEANEIDSWQKMTRVLSHEISNSVTPISTLGAGIHRKLSQGLRDKKGGLVLNPDAADDLIKSAELIEQRGNNLVDFMEQYKSFSRLPEPVLKKVGVESFFESLNLFFKEDMTNYGIDFKVDLADATLCIHADSKLFEQAFINLIRNATEALKDQESGVIELKAGMDADRKVALSISDNGPGIPVEIQSQIFIPFFTTKRGGSGIGLSLVRKVVSMSGGSITFQSEPGGGAKFHISMPGC
jgi:nitrogen fixation/metabolism regulation signal transduction histidine kinase